MSGTPERLRYTYWLHYAEGSVMPLLVMKLVLSRVPHAVPFLVRPVARSRKADGTSCCVEPRGARVPAPGVAP